MGLVVSNWCITQVVAHTDIETALIKPNTNILRTETNDTAAVGYDLAPAIFYGYSSPFMAELSSGNDDSDN